MFSKLMAALALVTLPCFAGYAYKATVNFSGATSSTQTNITLVAVFSDTKLKTAANGGQIQNTCTQQTLSVPCDLIVTNDATCATQTGSYTWDFGGDYSATAGTGHLWVLIPSYTTGGITPVVCIGNAAVNTWQGGSSAYDSNTQLAVHMGTSASLNVKDFSGNAITTTNSGSVAVTGQVGGAASMNGSSTYIAVSDNTALRITGQLTVEAWVNVAAQPNAYTELVRKGSKYYLFASNGNAVWLAINDDYPAGSGSTVTLTTGWHQYVGTYNAGAEIIYKDGGSPYSNNPGDSLLTGTDAMAFGAIEGGGGQFLPGSMDEVRVSSTARTANWIATEYGNQNSPPSVGAFTALTRPTLTLLGVGN